MDPNTTPQGNRPAYDQQHVDKLHKTITNCRHIINCQIQTLKIYVIGQGNGNLIEAQFVFKAGSKDEIPHEFKLFLNSYADRLYAESVTAVTDRTLVRLGNHIVDLEDLIREYTSTDTPSIDPDTVAAMRALERGSTMTVLINDTPHQLQKLS